MGTTLTRLLSASHGLTKPNTFDHRRKEIIASPFKVATDRHQPVDTVIQKLEKLAKKPAVPLPKSPSQLKVIKLRKTPSSSSSDTEKESLEATRAHQKLKRPKRHANRVHRPISKAYKKQSQTSTKNAMFAAGEIITEKIVKPRPPT